MNRCLMSLIFIIRELHIKTTVRYHLTLTRISSVQFSHSVMSDSLWPHGLQHARLPCPSPTPGTCSNSCPSGQWCHPTISSSVIPFSSCLQSFPATGSFPINQFFASGCQSVGVSVSASVLPMNIQDWFALGFTGLISLQSKGLSRVFSNTTVQKHQFFSTQLSLWSNSHISQLLLGWLLFKKKKRQQMLTGMWRNWNPSTSWWDGMVFNILLNLLACYPWISASVATCYFLQGKLGIPQGCIILHLQGQKLSSPWVFDKELATTSLAGRIQISLEWLWMCYLQLCL